MMSIGLYTAFVLASVILIIVPGPSVSVIIANSAAYGVRAGILTIVGNSTGLALLLVVLFLGMAPVMAFVSEWFDWFRVAGALYLIWLGITRIVNSHGARNPVKSVHTGGFVRQGFLVSLSNPKTLLFFGVFLPQFIDPAGNTSAQLALLAVTFLVLATALDSGYALIAGKARRWFAEGRERLVNRISGFVLVSGGLWLALARRT